MLSNRQTLMLNALRNADLQGIPIGLSELSDMTDFLPLLEEGLVNTAWVDVGSIKARITESGRAALAAMEGQSDEV